MKIAILTFLICIVVSQILSAQTIVCYTYDASGNRTGRNDCSKSAIATKDSMVVSQPNTKALGEMSLSLYPNPTKGQLTINIANMPDNANGEIILSDMTGRLLLKQSTFRVTTQLDLSSHPTGLYVLKIPIFQLIAKLIQLRL